MSTLGDQRCFNHHGREAVARCPECRNYFCRECITEHEGRVVCATCLGDAGTVEQDTSKRFNTVHLLLALCSVAILWLTFFTLGRALLMLPDSFHDGTVWSQSDGSNGDRP